MACGSLCSTLSSCEQWLHDALLVEINTYPTTFKKQLRLLWNSSEDLCDGNRLHFYFLIKKGNGRDVSDWKPFQFQTFAGQTVGKGLLSAYYFPLDFYLRVCSWVQLCSTHLEQFSLPSARGRRSKHHLDTQPSLNVPSASPSIHPKN